MRITWLGHASFLVEAGDAKLITDPFDKIGIQFPDVVADVVTTSHGHFDHNAVHLVGGSPKVVEGVVEAQHGPFKIRGYETSHDESGGSERGKNTVFVIEAEGVKVCHLGDLGHALSEKDVEAIGGVDVLMVPVGGTYTIDAAGAANVVKSLGATITIPMHYKIEGLSLPIAGVVDFTNRFANVAEMDALDVDAGRLPSENEVDVLKRRS